MRFPPLARAAAVLCLLLGAVAWADVTIPGDQTTVHHVGGPAGGGAWGLWTNGQITQTVLVRRAGRYQIVIRAWGTPAGGIWPQMMLLIDGREISSFTVAGPGLHDYTCAADLPADLCDISVRYLNDAVIGAEDRNLCVQSLKFVPPAGGLDPVPQDARQRLVTADRIQRQTLAAANADITRYRKALALIRLTNATGQPVANQRVRVQLIRHDFLFGCNIYEFHRFPTDAQNRLYNQRFAALFNYATIGFYWRTFEPKPGQADYARTDRVVAWCRRHDICMKGHPLLWGNPDGLPAWTPGLPSPQLQRQRIDEILARYGGQIKYWDVVNEPNEWPALPIAGPYRWAHQAAPGAYLFINDYNILYNGAPSFYHLVQQAQGAGVPFDGIGMQGHEPRGMRLPLERVRRYLKQYAALGKQIQISEFTPTSDGQPITGTYRRGVWTEAAQADYAEDFYRVCFANPAVTGITWWDLCDRGSWLKNGGLLRPDLSPKPAYRRLMRLIHGEWSTDLEGTTDADGRIRFRGFLGTYRLTVPTPAGPAELDFTLGRKQRPIDLKVPTP